uniref:Uncharacterized protein n=1 Tax=Globodera rostochiensis TaxID=31243 RepID=A0A914GVS9_GLORO
MNFTKVGFLHVLLLICVLGIVNSSSFFDCLCPPKDKKNSKQTNSEAKLLTTKSSSDNSEKLKKSPKCFEHLNKLKDKEGIFD